MTGAEYPLSRLSSAAHAQDISLSRHIHVDAASRVLAAQVARVQKWQARGYAGEMSYLLRSPESYASVIRLLPGLQSIVTFAVPYCRQVTQERPPGYGRVARYAWGRDYHKVLKKKLTSVITEAFGISRDSFRICADAIPLLERPLAAAAGLGFIGKNSLVLNPRLGSYFLLAEVLFSVPIRDDMQISESRGQATTADDRVTAGVGCGACTACLSGCPTGAIVESGVIDSRRCISYLTIEKRGAFSAWESASLGEWIFGCDLCQEVCPFNRATPVQYLADFGEDRGVGQFASLEQILRLRDHDALVDYCAGTPLMRAGITGLQRNAISVARNTAWVEGIPALEQFLRSDAEPWLRAQAKLALADLQKIS